ncbi:MAG TPA: hypothetical protein VIV40_18210 [Kofleriaceae bacterium]
MVLVTPPHSPSRATGQIEKLLVELGHPQLPELDEEQDALAEQHDELFEEIAAFARRGWAYRFDAESGMDYTPREYELVLGEILRPLGVSEVELDDRACILHVDARKIHVQAPEQDDDWLDVGWIFETANLAVSETGWLLLGIDDADMHEVIVGVVPHEVWTAMTERKLTGSWRAMKPVETLFN